VVDYLNEEGYQVILTSKEEDTPVGMAPLKGIIKHPAGGLPEVLKVMQDLALEGRTMVVVTHEMGFAREVSNQLVFLHKGQVEERGDPREVLVNPQSERLQQFLAGSLK